MSKQWEKGWLLINRYELIFKYKNMDAPEQVHTILNTEKLWACGCLEKGLNLVIFL